MHSDAAAVNISFRECGVEKFSRKE
uniref:Defective in cullin neddylation 1 domain containing 4 n=1 Tax=Homo sapiens TaxID=9606 RepID=D6RCB7_HUMAN